MFADCDVDVIRAVRSRAARNVHGRTEKHVALEMDEAEMTPRTDIDVLVQARIRARENGAELDRDAPVEVGENAGEKRAAEVLADGSGDERQELRRALERAIGAEESGTDAIDEQLRRDEDGRHAVGGPL